MKFIIDRIDYEMTDDLFQKIREKFKKEVLANKKEIAELAKEDRQYNNKKVTVEDLVETIELFNDAKVVSKKKNNIVFYYGNVQVTIQVLLESIRCQNTINICIENQSLAVNKLLVRLFEEILKDFKIKKCVSFNTYKIKEVEDDLELFDTAIFIGNRNLYNLLRDKTSNEKYIPFDCLDILVLGNKYEDFAREVLNVAIESDVEAEIFEDMKKEIAIDYLNQYGNKYMLLILAANKKDAEEIKNNINYKHVLINENPFEKKISNIIV